MSEIPDDFQTGEWLRGDGPDSGVAISTRVRFARNVRGYRFAPQMTDTEAQELRGFLTDEFQRLAFAPKLGVVDISGLEELERTVLVERHLISRELANSDRARSVALDDGESVSVMLNEEDHIRAQVFHSGFAVADAYRRAEALDEALLKSLPLAFSEEFGFLTSCPTNAGTGLRVSVMLHLPGLVMAEEMDKATNTAQKIHLAVRGLYGEGSRALGDFYQVSNQVTLGRSEEDILEDVSAAVTRLISWEREVREALLQGDSRTRTLDKVFRALGTLRNAHILTSEECFTCLSSVRLGVEAGEIEGIGLRDVSRLLLLTQPGHLQRMARQFLGPAERDERRAALVREVMAAAHHRS